MSEIYSGKDKLKQDNLSFTSGFNFGCGFWVAWIGLLFIVIPVIVVVGMILVTLGLIAL